MNKGLYAGSFDPFTYGHLNVLKQASKIFDEVILAISINAEKKRRIDIVDMEKAILKTIEEEGIKNVRIIKPEGLTAEIAKNEGAEFLIHGLRNVTDFDYEENIAKINEEINPHLDNIYFRAGKTSHISSSAVMEILKLGGDILNWVPYPVYEIITKKNI